MSTDKTAEKADDIIQLAKDCLENYKEREADNIQRAEEAIRFRALEQWPEAIKNDRENRYQDGGPRPCPVLDKTNQYVRQVINEERQNRAAIRVRPVDDHSDPKVAEILTGIIRHIEDQSDALEAYTKAGEHAIDGGFGYWRILTEYTDPMSFDQDIRIKRIHNRFSVALGPHTEADGSDAREALIWEDMTLKDFEAEYPKADTAGFEDSGDWGGEETIRVAEYMCIKTEPMTIHQMEDGSVITDEQLQEAIKQYEEQMAMPQDPEYPQEIVYPEPVATRQSMKERVKWYKLTGKEILDKRDMLGSYIPVVKVTGNEITMPDGKIRLSGMIESMMDPQRLHNYSHAGFIEHVALAPRAPWVAAEESVEGYEADYENANRKPVTLLKFKHLDEAGNMVPPPQRTPPAGIAPGWQQMLMNTEHGIEAAGGMYGPSVGAKSQEKSGIALQEQKQQGMVGNFHFPDNLARSIQHCGRILVQWIPGVYDTNRVARILGEDGEQELIRLNPDQEQPVLQDEISNNTSYNINLGKYDVTVSTGPSYTSKRQEAADNMLQLVKAKPEIMQIAGDLLFANLDMAGADKIAERLKVMLPPQIQELESKDGPVDPQVAMLRQQIKAAHQQIEEKSAMLNQAKEAIDKMAQDTEAEQAKVEAAKEKLAVERAALDVRAQKLMLDIREKALDLAEDKEKLEDALENILATHEQNIAGMLQQFVQPTA